MTSWEYSHVEASGVGDGDWKDALDELGRDGWELVTLRPDEKGNMSFLLKRPAIEGPISAPLERSMGGKEFRPQEHFGASTRVGSNEFGRPPARRYHAVTQTILASIADGRLKVGDRLPNERRLAAVCGASRPTVRDALLALELIGVIEVRPGSGAYVSRSSPRSGALMAISFDAPPRELIEARMEIEPAVARLCATRVGSADIERLSQLVDRCEEEGKRSPADAPESFLKLSLQFHGDLAALCGNDILARLTQQLVDVTAHPLWMLVNGIHLRTSEARAAQVAEHRAVLRAIANREVNDAGSFMADHLRSLSQSTVGVGDVTAQQ